MRFTLFLLPLVAGLPWLSSTVPGTSSSTETTEIVELLSWTQATASPVARIFPGLATLTDLSVLMFGGKGSDGVLNDAWYFEAGIWWSVCRLESPVWPSARSNMVLANVAENVVFLFGGINNEGAVMTDTYTFHIMEREWKLITPTGDVPEGIVYPMSASLTGLGKVLLFGGKTQSDSWLGETFIYTYATNSWEMLPSVGNSPTQRTLGAIASAAGGVLLFGGMNSFGGLLNDIWFFDSATLQWNEMQQSPWSTVPSPSMNMMASSLNNGSVVLAGGSQGTGIFLEEAYLVIIDSNSTVCFWPQIVPPSTANLIVQGAGGAAIFEAALFFGGSGASLESMQPSTVAWIPTVSSGATPFQYIPVRRAPEKRFMAGMATVVTGYALLFGGRGVGSSEILSDTWIFALIGSAVSWARMNSTINPPGLAGSCTVNGGHNFVLLFGGYLPFDLLSNATYYFRITEGDARDLNGQWTEVSSDLTPPARALAVGAYMGNNTAIMFGGIQPNGILTDMFSFSSTSLQWSAVTTTGSAPPALYSSSMSSTIVDDLHYAVLFGGTNENGESVDSTWLFRLDTSTEGVWALLQPLISPSKRTGCSMSPLSQAIILVGGQDSHGAFGINPWMLNVSVAVQAFAGDSSVPALPTWIEMQVEAGTASTTQMPSLRAHGGIATLHNDTVILFGGESLFEERLGSVWVGVTHNSVLLSSVPTEASTWQLWQTLVVIGGGIFVLLSAIIAIYLYRSRQANYNELRSVKLRERPNSSEETDEFIGFEEITLGEIIGSGSSGTVFKGQCHRSPAAIKRLHAVFGDLKEWQEEIKLMKALRHPNVLFLLGGCRDPHSNELYIVTELAPLGDLNKFLRVSDGESLAMGVRLSMISDVARGIMFLHSRRILHRDLKSPNLFVFAGPVVKVGDFGLSRKFKMGDNEGVLTSVAGTPLWTAPESLSHSMFSPASDVYSFGIVMWEVFTGKIPYDGERVGFGLLSAIIAGKRPELPDGLPLHLSSLMTRCWDADQTLRPSMQDVVSELESITGTPSALDFSLNFATETSSATTSSGPDPTVINTESPSLHDPSVSSRARDFLLTSSNKSLTSSSGKEPRVTY